MDNTVRRARNRRSTELRPIGRRENSRSTELGLNAGHAECPAGRWWEEVEKSGEHMMTGHDVIIIVMRLAWRRVRLPVGAVLSASLNLLTYPRESDKYGIHRRQSSMQLASVPFSEQETRCLPAPVKARCFDILQ